MRMTTIFAIIPSCRLWLLSSAAALVFLLLLKSQLSRVDTTVKFEDLGPRRRPSKGADTPPVLAYRIIGSKGENKRILRLLNAIYHPRNQYLLQLDSSSNDQERTELALATRSRRVFREFGNVNVVGRGYGVTPMGASGLGAVLHAAALLMRISADWDWFIPLTTSDYPILTQDDILYAFASLPKDVNFLGYANYTSWERRRNLSQIAIDPNLYLKEQAPIFYTAETRENSDTFQVFGGSPWMVLSRGFLEHCVIGWDNFPRKLLMYMTNLAFPLESYFQTVLCNTPEFRNSTVVSDNLRHAIIQNTSIAQLMESRAIFAGPFMDYDDGMLQEIDEQLLNRGREGIVPGKWCLGTGLVNDSAPSSFWGDIDGVEAGDEGIRLHKILSRVGDQDKKVAISVCQNHVMQKQIG